MKHTLSDIWVMTKRNLMLYIRLPQLVIFSTIQPVMFILLFGYVFGGAINVPGETYINFLLPGILIQTVLFGAMMTGLGLAHDISQGMVDRFRSLPMSRAALLAGRTLSDLMRNIFVILLMTGVGFLMGFRFKGDALDILAAFLLALLFSHAFSWISATLGLALKHIETVQSAGFIWIFPLAFISSIFVPLETMNKYFRAFAEVNPVTSTVNAVWALALSLPVGNNTYYSLAWNLGILLIFIPLSVRFFRRLE